MCERRMVELVCSFGLVLKYLALSCKLRRLLSQNPQDRWVDSFPGMTHLAVACMYLLSAPEKITRNSS